MSCFACLSNVSCVSDFLLIVNLYFVSNSRALLYHCVPEMAVIQGIALGHSMYDFVSSYVPLKKVLSDIINAHEEMVIMGIVAIVSAFISAFVIHFLASLASWLILLLISVLLIRKYLFYIVEYQII